MEQKHINNRITVEGNTIWIHHSLPSSFPELNEDEKELIRKEGHRLLKMDGIKVIAIISAEFASSENLIRTIDRLSKIQF